MVAQLQQGFNLKETKFTAGSLHDIATTPQTKGTIMGRNEDDDIEMGAYLQMTHPISDRVDFTGAVRGDMNSRIEALPTRPASPSSSTAPTQNWRLTYNRAFNSPASFSFFLDQFGNRANLGPALGNLDVQILGNQPKTGWNYDRSCDAAVNNGLCMRSPFDRPARSRPGRRTRSRASWRPSRRSSRVASPPSVSRPRPSPASRPRSSASPRPTPRSPASSATSARPATRSAGTNPVIPPSAPLLNTWNSATRAS